VRFGPPIDTEALARTFHKGALLRAITDEVMDAIAAMSGQERSGRYASDVKAELSSM
jgi:1-acyl-sn-glycerol-3-phosphate acyltransferase